MLALKRHREPDELVPLIPSDRWIITTSTAHATYPSSKLKTDNLDDFWRAWGQRRSHTWVQVEYPYSAPDNVELDMVALLGINRQLPKFPDVADIDFTDNKVRMIIDTFPETAYNPRVQSVSLTNVTGSYTVLNQTIDPPEETLAEGYIPSALLMVSNTLDTEITAVMGNYTLRPLLVGADLQELQVHVRHSRDSALLPEITTTIRQGGVDKATLTFSTIEKTSEGFKYYYYWNASVLTNLTDPVSVKVHGSKTTFGGNSTVEYLGIAWHAEVSGTLYDTGWQTIENPKQVTWLPQLSLTTPASGRFYIIIQFSDFSSITTASTVKPSGGFQGVTIYSPLGEAFHAGRFVGGEAINLPLRDNNAFNIRRIGNNEGSLNISNGGQFRAIRPDMTRKQLDMTTIPQPSERFYSEIEPWAIELGNVGHSLFVDDSRRVGAVDYTKLLHPEALWGVINSFECPDLGLMMGSDGESTDPPHLSDKYHTIMISVLQSNADLTRR